VGNIILKWLMSKSLYKLFFNITAKNVVKRVYKKLYLLSKMPGHAGMWMLCIDIENFIMGDAVDEITGKYQQHV